MNKILAAAFGFFNGILALFLIIIGALTGFISGEGVGESGLGAVAGFFAGLFGAVVVCGLFAVLLDIRSELKKLNEVAQRVTR